MSCGVALAVSLALARSMPEFDVIIDGQKCFTLDRVTDLTGVDAGEIRASVRAGS